MESQDKNGEENPQMKEICVTYGSLKYFWLSNYAKPWLSKVVKLWSWCAITKIDKHQTNKVIKINGRVKINNSYFYFLLDLTKYGVPQSLVNIFIQYFFVSQFLHSTRDKHCNILYQAKIHWGKLIFYCIWILLT